MGTRPQSTEPFLAVVNVRIWTGAADAPSAEAVALTGTHLTALGSNDEIRALAGPRSRVIDAAGRRLIPGITDSHTHLLWAGEQLLRLDLRDGRGKKDFINRVADSAWQLPAWRWLRGGAYTVTPPFAVLREHDLGVIAAGRRADLAMLDRDILECDVDELPDTKADLTIVNSDIVWPRDGSDR